MTPAPDSALSAGAERGNGPAHVAEGTDALLAAFAHDMRNPLGPVRNAVWLLRTSGQRDGEAAQWALDVIDRQVQVLAGMIDDLSDFARLRRGALQTENDVVDLERLIDRAVSAFAKGLGEKQQTLRRFLPDGPTLTLGDRARLVQALATVLSAASRATAHGAQLSLRVHRTEHDVSISVGDDALESNPIGATPIPGGRASEARRISGRMCPEAGVGLTLAQGILEIHGGSLSVVPDRAGRPRFAIRLPLAPGLRGAPRLSPSAG